MCIRDRAYQDRRTEHDFSVGTQSTGALSMIPTWICVHTLPLWPCLKAKWLKAGLSGWPFNSQHKTWGIIMDPSYKINYSFVLVSDLECKMICNLACKFCFFLLIITTLFSSLTDVILFLLTWNVVPILQWSILSGFIGHTCMSSH